MDVAVVGAGKVGTAVALALRSAGHRVVAVSGRTSTAARAARYLPGVPVLGSGQAARRAPVVIVAVPDDVLASVISTIATEGGFREGGWAVHVSGAATLEVLDPALNAGANRLAVHPLQTFPTAEDALERLRGAGIAVTADDDEGDAFGMSLARDMGGVPFRVHDQDRPLYHAAAVFASNYLVAVSAVAAELFSAAGLEDPAAAMAPLQRATLQNIERLGAGAALTGPAVRGDVTTIERNLAALAASRADAVVPYVALCRVATQLGLDAGRLTPDDARVVVEVLDTWM
jgi:predicted short-subunit dehydrogenase-like oxidoreductase (DUF2520 family)